MDVLKSPDFLGTGATFTGESTELWNDPSTVEEPLGWDHSSDPMSMYLGDLAEEYPFLGARWSNEPFSPKYRIISVI